MSQNISTQDKTEEKKSVNITPCLDISNLKQTSSSTVGSIDPTCVPVSVPVTLPSTVIPFSPSEISDLDYSKGVVKEGTKELENEKRTKDADERKDDDDNRKEKEQKETEERKKDRDTKNEKDLKDTEERKRDHYKRKEKEPKDAEESLKTPTGSSKTHTSDTVLRKTSPIFIDSDTAIVVNEHGEIVDEDPVALSERPSNEKHNPQPWTILLQKMKDTSSSSLDVSFMSLQRLKVYAKQLYDGVGENEFEQKLAGVQKKFPEVTDMVEKLNKNLLQLVSLVARLEHLKDSYVLEENAINAKRTHYLLTLSYSLLPKGTPQAVKESVTGNIGRYKDAVLTRVLKQIRIEFSSKIIDTAREVCQAQKQILDLVRIKDMKEIMIIHYMYKMLEFDTSIQQEKVQLEQDEKEFNERSKEQEKNKKRKKPETPLIRLKNVHYKRRKLHRNSTESSAYPSSTSSSSSSDRMSNLNYSSRNSKSRHSFSSYRDEKERNKKCYN